jgi:hypothetical protein
MIKAAADDENLKVRKGEILTRAAADDERIKLERDKELLRLRSKPQPSKKGE